ncbi:MAG: nitrite reductase small subunit NirD [Bryobacteraceae bacterium]
MSWIRITEASNVPLREGRCIKVGSEDIAIFNLGDRFAAIDNRCPHSGGPLCDGIVAGASVVCPLHGWKIDLETGGIIRPQVPAFVEVYPVKVEEGVLLIDIPVRREDFKYAAA